MSYGIQSSLNLAETHLFADSCEESEGQEMQNSLSNASGSLKSGSKQYIFTSQPQATKAKEAREYVLQLGTPSGKHIEQAEKPSFMNMAMASAYRPSSQSSKGEAQQTFVRPNGASVESNPAHTTFKNSELTSHARTPQATTAQSTHIKSPSGHIAKEASKAKGQETRGERKGNEREATSSLANRKWSTEETRKWWDARYDQRERQGGQQKQDQQEGKEQEERALRVTKKGRCASRNTSSLHMNTEKNAKARKPDLTPPKMGVFALYYVLTKMGIQSDGASNFSYKKEIELVNGQVTETHKKRLEELKEAIDRETESTRWGVASKIFSWMASIIGMISGAVLIATGVGAVAGSMMIIGGMIQITNQILEMSGGWQKIAALLPGEDTEKKGAVVAWMQIGVAVLCLILAGVGAIWGGFANFQEVTGTATAFMGAIATMGHGITTMGQGINVFMFKNSLSDIKQFELRLAQLKHMRQDLMEKVEWGIDRLGKLFEDLAKALEFDEELFYADQMLYRR